MLLTVLKGECNYFQLFWTLAIWYSWLEKACFGDGSFGTRATHTLALRHRPGKAVNDYKA